MIPVDRYRVIERFAKENNWTHGLELGVWVGVTTFWLMKNTSVNMTCVDAWEVQDDNPEYDWQYNKKPIFKGGKLVRLEEFKHSGLSSLGFYDFKRPDKRVPFVVRIDDELDPLFIETGIPICKRNARCGVRGFTDAD